jgi:hypothetical protein
MESPLNYTFTTITIGVNEVNFITFFYGFTIKKGSGFLLKYVEHCKGVKGVINHYIVNIRNVFRISKGFVKNI